MSCQPTPLGVAGFTGPPRLTGNQPFTLAITGGTGAYRTARGQAQVTPVSETEQRYTLTVIR